MKKIYLVKGITVDFLKFCCIEITKIKQEEFMWIIIILNGFSMGNLGKPYIYPENAHPEKHRKLLLLQEPTVSVYSENRKAIIEVKTTIDVPPIGIYYGLYFPGGIKTPQFGRLSREKKATASKEHRVIIPLDFLENPKYDRCNFKEKGGVIYYRLEIRNPKYNVNTFFGGRFRVDRNYKRVPCIILGPFVDQIGSCSAIISWETDTPCYGEIIIRGKSYSDGEESRMHEVKIEGLNPGEIYMYRVIIGGEVRGEYHFKTVPKNGNNFEFAVLCDSRAGSGGGERYYGESCNYYILTRLLLDAYNRGSDFILFPGDLVNGYMSCEFEFRYQLKNWKRATEGIGASIPIYEGMGNHEALLDIFGDMEFDKLSPHSAENIFSLEFVNPLNGPLPEQSMKEMAPPYTGNVYYFDYGNSMFISFNTNYAYCSNPLKYGGNLEGYVMDGQLDWIDRVIKEADKNSYIKHIFLFAHEPSFPNGGHLGDAQWYHGKKPFVIERKDELWRIISNSKKVVAVFYGDEHNYHRMLVDSSTVFYEEDGYVPQEKLVPKNPVWQIVSGGAGAPYHTQEDSPWSESVHAFYPGYNYCFIWVKGDTVKLTAYNEVGELIDDCVLTD